MRAEPGAEPAAGSTPEPARGPAEGSAGSEPSAPGPAAPGPARAAAQPAASAPAGTGPAGPAASERALATGSAKSRRFPSVTRDTARPEGSGRAVPGAVSTPARQWPMLAVLIATAAGLLTTAMGHPRVGCLVIGVALIVASVLRRLLPSVGMLAVRSRFTDMVTYGLLGVAITLLALVMEPKPLLEVPFLESAVRFTVR
ncbi:DUF3017 domain-containing protein [Streptomyces sp. NBC_01408]|uniref:DUF3017 domain-containing protein n=1 Tax=Streptomyces sp. NBC_01408 TaxID=2903855 RepID=UPI002252E6B2|nr:DUF3017 domain-containing protein [Streptomyces sp. NBC_01408]MCX4691459.1 DUF3017 domain-containing protein [Streptomyces sp. NBC_01408]